MHRFFREYLFVVLFIAGCNSFLFAQPINDECTTPIELSISSGSWCSDIAEFTNEAATLSGDLNEPFCWPNDPIRPDVWYTFIAQATDASIIVNGNSDGIAGGTLDNPQFALYEGNCGGTLTEIACFSDAFGDNIIESFVSNLTIGQRYYLMVGARFQNEGTYQICINSFNSVPDPKSDCKSAVLLCDKSSFTVQALQGVGQETNEVFATCVNNEFASAWYKWVCEEPGSLTFTLTPSNPTDDLDFAVYELPGGIDDCDNKTVLRCMASGENVGQPASTWQPCTGPTGLSLSDNDFTETAGCNAGDNNFVRFIDMEAGKAYALIVNNFSNTGNGFSISWGGTGTFLGPKADVEILDGQTVECDKEFTIDEVVDFELGNIIGYQWNFGVDASPQKINQEGPHQVTYNSIGTKSIVLTLQTDSGCVVNQVLNIEVEPCCEDFPDIDILTDSTIDLRCNGIPEGEIYLSGLGGTPQYMYSLDGEYFQFNPFFTQMESGQYLVFIRDIKGCVDSLIVDLTQPPPLLVNAGPDLTVDLGFGTDLFATVSPPGIEVSYQWQPEEAADPDNQPDTYVIPPGQTTFTVTVVDSQGCVAIDSVTIFVNDNRPIYIPNAISPNGDNINDKLTVYSNPAAVQVKSLQIFNRWGDLVWEDRDFPLNDPNYGWNGTFNGKQLDPDVFVYKAIVTFVDSKDVLFSGDIHLMR